MKPKYISKYTCLHDKGDLTDVELMERDEMLDKLFEHAFKEDDDPDDI